MSQGQVIGIVVLVLSIALIVLVMLVKLLEPKVSINNRRSAGGKKWLVEGKRGSSNFTAMGSSTVWHYYPSGTRCSINMEEYIVNEMARLDNLIAYSKLKGVPY